MSVEGGTLPEALANAGEALAAHRIVRDLPRPQMAW